MCRHLLLRVGSAGDGAGGDGCEGWGAEWEQRVAFSILGAFLLPAVRIPPVSLVTARQSITDPLHRDAATLLRAVHRQSKASPVRAEVEHRDLSDYDRMAGIDSEVA